MAGLCENNKAFGIVPTAEELRLIGLTEREISWRVTVGQKKIVNPKPQTNPTRFFIPKDMAKRKKENCFRCRYASGRMGKTPADSVFYITCGYLEATGQRRPCDPSECREAGVFKPLRKKRRARACTIAN